MIGIREIVIPALALACAFPVAVEALESGNESIGYTDVHSGGLAIVTVTVTETATTCPSSEHSGSTTPVETPSSIATPTPSGPPTSAISTASTGPGGPPVTSETPTPPVSVSTATHSTAETTPTESVPTEGPPPTTVPTSESGSMTPTSIISTTETATTRTSTTASISIPPAVGDAGKMDLNVGLLALWAIAALY